MLVAQYQFILVLHRSVQARSIQDLIAYIRALQPGQFQYASTGVGSPNHLAAEMFKKATGLNITHVPYNGGGPATIAVVGGETKMLFASIPSVLGHIKSGALRGIAVTGPNRAAEAPDVPTMQELAYADFDVRAWNGVLAPAGTPKQVITRLNRELTHIITLPEVRERFKREGLDPSTNTPEEFAARMRSEASKWAQLIKASGIKAE
jgi:tripartite-type tricarboxylate transporter receptor subunit TctC